MWIENEHLGESVSSGTCVSCAHFDMCKVVEKLRLVNIGKVSFECGTYLSQIDVEAMQEYIGATQA